MWASGMLGNNGASGEGQAGEKPSHDEGEHKARSVLGATRVP
jgi:hypothetical protein